MDQNNGPGEETAVLHTGRRQREVPTLHAIYTAAALERSSERCGVLNAVQAGKQSLPQRAHAERMSA